MATRQKHDIESALMRLQKIAREDTIGLEKEKISNMLAMATGLTMLKQVAKAKNQLRAIDRMPFKWDDADAFERAWLMLANIHMQVRASIKPFHSRCKRGLIVDLTK
jgi:tetratricopeptide repeat protein 21B